MQTNTETSEEKVEANVDIRSINDEIHVEYTFKKLALYKSNCAPALFESSTYDTPFPGCQLHWRAHYFRDIFNEPPQHILSLELLSCHSEEDTNTDLELPMQITGKCWIKFGPYTKSIPDIKIQIRDILDLDIPIVETFQLNADIMEKQLLRHFGKDLMILLGVNVDVEFKSAMDLVFNVRGRNLVDLPSIQFMEEEERVTYHEEFPMFDDIYVSTCKFEKFTNYKRGEDLRLLQSKLFSTRFSGGLLMWKVRYFRNVFQKPIQHSVCLQLIKCKQEAKKRTHIHVYCQLKFNQLQQSALVADFDMPAEKQALPITKSINLDGESLEKLLKRDEGDMRVGLEVNVSVYDRNCRP